jgi:hypothetical protein
VWNLAFLFLWFLVFGTLLGPEESGSVALLRECGGGGDGLVALWPLLGPLAVSACAGLVAMVFVNWIVDASILRSGICCSWSRFLTAE